MKHVAKLVLTDAQDNHLLLYRSDHPMFGHDPDLPGGTVEDGETLLEALLREVWEEIGVKIDATLVRELYTGSDYSAHGTYYGLFHATLPEQPELDISWEHSRYEWLERSDFLAKSRGANDTFMHMVSDVIGRHKDEPA